MSTHRGPLPYGIVMATAGAATLAESCGLHAASLPLLLFAIAQAVWIPFRHVMRHHPSPADRLTVSPSLDQTGLFTIPLGLAVITTQLASQVGPGWQIAASACLMLTWLATVVLTGHFIGSMFRIKSRLRHLDGAWFLVPAALLGVAIATARLSLHADSLVQTPLRWLAFCSATMGLVGYWITALAAAVRIARHGLGDSRSVLWWIAMGCAGLSAAAIATILEPGHAVPAGGIPVLSAALSATLVLAAILLVPVVIGSTKFLASRCRFSGPAAWPPTFSTAVFALGYLGAGAVLHLQWVVTIGRIAAMATLLLWTVTILWNIHLTRRRRVAMRRD